MKISNITIGVVCILLATLLGCSKPEDNLVGKWVNEKTGSVIEFKSDKSGAIYQRTNPALPPNIPIAWEIVGDKQIKVEVKVEGAAARPAMGRLSAKDILVLEQDTFNKMK